jgi:cytoskeletal protein CcmA (bactofilin family)
MWNRKREDEYPSRPASPSAPEPTSPVEAIPTNPYSSRRVEEATIRAAAAIGKSIIVKGTVLGKEDLLVDGRVDGDIELPEHRLTVGAGGHVHGGVRAREIVIYGTVQGNLEAGERVEIKKNARVIGDLRAQRPVIEDEAYFKGNVETIRVDQPKAQPQPQAKAAAAAAAEPVQPTLTPDGEPKRG